MIWFDDTKTRASKHKSGLLRLGARLREELGAEARTASWTDVAKIGAPTDWFVTTELFSETERPDFQEFLRSGRIRKAAIFADAIPLKFPHITWPQSVARHPSYLRLLADFDRVWAISAASRDELVGYWKWLGLGRTPPVEVLPLGADLSRSARAHSARVPENPSLLCVGIVEPRKNQLLMLEACVLLWAEGLAFELNLVGRVNPHFGKPIVAQIKTLRRTYPNLRYHEAVDDRTLERLYSEATATVFPTLAEGCGLPLLESLWHGVPCVCSDLPVLRENADDGGCLTVPTGDLRSWRDAIARVVTDRALGDRLRSEALTRSLPTWAQAARILRDGLVG
jgi:glycosyltransferase involved in cell wall biosynthesis